MATLYDAVFDNSSFYVYGRLFPSFHDIIQLCIDQKINKPAFYVQTRPESEYHEYLSFSICLTDGQVTIDDVHFSNEYSVQLGISPVLYHIDSDSLITDCWVYDKYDDSGEGWFALKLDNFFRSTPTILMRGITSRQHVPMGRDEEDRSVICYWCGSNNRYCKKNTRFDNYCDECIVCYRCGSNDQAIISRTGEFLLLCQDCSLIQDDFPSCQI